VSDVAGDAPNAAHAAPSLRRLRLSRRSLVAVFAAMVLALGARAALVQSVDVIVLASGAAVVASLLHPLVALVGRRLPRPAALVVTLLGAGGLIGVLVASVVGGISDQTTRLRRTLPEAALRLEGQTDRVGRAAREFGLSARVRELVDALPDRLAGGSGADAVTTNAGRGVTVLAGAVLTMFLLLYGPRLTSGAPRLLRRPEMQARARTVAAAAYSRAWRYAWTRLGVAVVSGLAGAAIAALFDVPGGVVLGVVIGLGSLVPGLGIVVAGLPLVLLTAGLHGDGTPALVLLVGLQIIETVAVQRRLSRWALRVGPAPSLLAALVGFEAGGVGVALIGLAAVVGVAAVLTEVAPEPSGDA
jgi:putative heme transporter